MAIHTNQLGHKVGDDPFDDDTVTIVQHSDASGEKLTLNLNIKVLTTLENIAQKYDNGEINVKEANMCLETLFTAVSGSVSDEIFQLITKMSTEYKIIIDQFEKEAESLKEVKPKETVSKSDETSNKFASW